MKRVRVPLQPKLLLVQEEAGNEGKYIDQTGCNLVALRFIILALQQPDSQLKELISCFFQSKRETN